MTHWPEAWDWYISQLGSLNDEFGELERNIEELVSNQEELIEKVDSLDRMFEEVSGEVLTAIVDCDSEMERLEGQEKEEGAPGSGKWWGAQQAYLDEIKARYPQGWSEETRELMDGSCKRIEKAKEILAKVGSMLYEAKIKGSG